MDYRKYKFSIKELVVWSLVWAAIAAVLAYFFYRSVIAFGILFLCLPIFLIRIKRYLKEKREWTMTLEFKEMVRFLSSDLQAGLSVENSFYRVYSEMKNMFGEQSVMTNECGIILRGLQNNVVIENLLRSLAQRTDIDEILEFAEVFSTAKRSGGNLREIIWDTTEAIDSKIEIKREFRVLMASGKTEQRIMCFIPFGIIMYIGITSPGYFDILYHNASGIMIMTVCLGVYVGAFLWGEKILQIQV